MGLNSDAQKVIELIKESGRPQFECVPVEEGRAAYSKSREILQPEPRAILEVRDLQAPGSAGPIQLRLYRDVAADASNPPPVLVYYHGGGWVIGDLDSHDGICREMAHQSGATVISVDYRLAPEDVFPAAVDDALAATQWVSDNAASLSVDPQRISIGGDSAGGNIAAVVSIMARDNPNLQIVSQLLIYPVMDLTMAHPSHERLANQQPIPRSTLSWFYDCYVPAKSDRTDWRASPLMAEKSQLEGLPPTLMLTAGFDPLGDEGVAFSKALSEAGNIVEEARFEGQIHGFLTMGKLIAETNVAFSRITAFLKAHGT